MNGKIGSVTAMQGTVITGEHHIIQNCRIADGIKDLAAGELMVYGENGLVRATDKDAAIDAVLLEDFAAETDGTVLNVCVHGEVRAEKLRLGKAAATQAVRAALNARGIYPAGTFLA